MLQRLRENKSAQGPACFPHHAVDAGAADHTSTADSDHLLWQAQPDGDVIYTFTLDNYIRLLGYSTNCDNGAASCFNPLYLNILWRSISLAFNTTFWVILLAFPLAYYIARANPKRRNTLLFLVLIPLWTNFVIRVYAWMMLLRKEGAINIILGSIADVFNIPFQPLEMLYTPGAVLVGMVYEFLPFMILPIYTSLEKIEPSLYEAAADLGANGLKTFWRVTLPLAMPGVVAGTILERLSWFVECCPVFVHANHPGYQYERESINQQPLAINHYALCALPFLTIFRVSTIGTFNALKSSFLYNYFRNRIYKE